MIWVSHISEFSVEHQNNSKSSVCFIGIPRILEDF